MLDNERRLRKEQIGRIEKVFEESEARLVKVHAEHVEILNAEIKRRDSQITTQQVRLDDKAEREANKGILADLLILLNDRLIEVRELNRYQYEGELAKAEWDKTIELLNRVSSVLVRHIGASEAVIFKIGTPDSLPAPEKYDMFTERFQQWVWHVKTLEKKEAELRKVIESL